MAARAIPNPLVWAACIDAASRIVAAHIGHRHGMRRDEKGYQEGEMASELYELAAILYEKIDQHYGQPVPTDLGGGNAG